MGLVLNELSFDRCNFSIHEAKDRVNTLVSIIAELNNKFDVRIQDIYGNLDAKNIMLAKDLCFFEYIGKHCDREEKRLLLSLLVDTRRYEMDEEVSIVKIDDDVAQGGTWAHNNLGVMISIESKEKYRELYVSGYADDAAISIRNIAYADGILEHAAYIVVRIYQPNKKHRKEEYVRTGSEKVSPMDLNDLEAQRVLNKAIEYKGRLYGKTSNSIYRFMKTHGSVFHGFKCCDLGKEETKRINQLFEDRRD